MDFKPTQETYPPPEERYSPPDFPPVDALYTYGEDIPVPASLDGLRCQYNFPDPEEVNIELSDLDGYKVPPYGLDIVTKAGGGANHNKAGKCVFIYSPGTFFDNNYTIGKPLGATPAELTVLREQARKDALVSGAIAAFEELGFDALANLRDKDARVIHELTKQTMKIVYGSGNPRESLNMLKYMNEKLAEKNAAIENNQRRAKAMTPEEALEWMRVYEKAQNLPVIEGEIEDI